MGSWDLPLVLRSLTQHPCKPIGHADLRSLSHKTVLHLDICSAKRVSDLHAVSVSGLNMEFSGCQIKLVGLIELVTLAFLSPRWRISSSWPDYVSSML